MPSTARNICAELWTPCPRKPVTLTTVQSGTFPSFEEAELDGGWASTARTQVRVAIYGVLVLFSFRVVVG